MQIFVADTLPTRTIGSVVVPEDALVLDLYRAVLLQFPNFYKDGFGVLLRTGAMLRDPFAKLLDLGIATCFNVCAARVGQAIPSFQTNFARNVDCCVCLSLLEPIHQVFAPCFHACVCQKCAAACTQCPVCHSPIQLSIPLEFLKGQ